MSQMSQIYKSALDSVDARRMLLELKAYTHALPETLKLGAQHLLIYMEHKAGESQRARWREPVPPAKGVNR